MVMIDNLKKPDNRKLKAIADWLLYCLPLMNGAIIAMPLTTTQISWVLFGLNTAIVVFKGISKFTTDEPV